MLPRSRSQGYGSGKGAKEGGVGTKVAWWNDHLLPLGPRVQLHRAFLGYRKERSTWGPFLQELKDGYYGWRNGGTVRLLMLRVSLLGRFFCIMICFALFVVLV